MISRTGKHALHILGYLVQHPGDWISGQDIAKATCIPANYQGKILNTLAKHGFVESRKGWGGGFKINPAALDRSIDEVLEIVEGPTAAEGKECVYGLGLCNDSQPCPLHPYFKPIRGAFDNMLHKVTIGELVAEK
ncbi:MAG: Rrf2 family transcriptional regulator [Pseudomonadota bacterium]